LSRLTNYEDGDMINDHFLYEYLFTISEWTTWFYDITNYLTIERFSQHFSYIYRWKIIRKSTTYTWIAGYCFKLVPY
jgi:hypothetical protein